MHKVWQAEVLLYPACVHTATLCSFSSPSSPASPSIRQYEEGRFFALLFRTFEKSPSLFAGFFVAGSHAFQMFFKRIWTDKWNQESNKNNITFVLLRSLRLWKESLPSSLTTSVPCSYGFWSFLTPVGREGNLLWSGKPKESLLSIHVPLGSTGFSPDGSQHIPTWPSIQKKLPNHVFAPWWVVFPLQVGERLALSITCFYLFSPVHFYAWNDWL